MLYRLLLSLLLVASGWGLSAQGLFDKPNTPDSPTCPRILRDKNAMEIGAHGLGAGSMSMLYHQEGDWFFPRAERKDVSPFSAIDAKGKGTSIASLKGKVVLVGLWSTGCEPSTKMLLEFASLYAKRAQFGFELLAVNFDENQQDGGGIEGGWRRINSWMIKNRQFFEASKMAVYTPGIGKEGPSTFMDMVWSIPVLFVIDRDGKLAETHIGYKDGFVGKALMRGLGERPVPTAPTAPPAPAPAPETPKK